MSDQSTPSGAAAQAGPPQDEKAWRCFHCDEVFTDEAEARAHFGEDQTGTTAMGQAACVIAASDGGLLKALRESEREVGALRHQAEQLEYDAQPYAMMSSELTQRFGVGVRTAFQAWLKLEAMESRAMAAEEQLAALSASRTDPPLTVTVTEIRSGEENDGPLQSTDLFIEGPDTSLLCNVKAGESFTYSLNGQGGTVGASRTDPPQATQFALDSAWARIKALEEQNERLAEMVRTDPAVPSPPAQEPTKQAREFKRLFDRIVEAAAIARTPSGFSEETFKLGLTVILREETVPLSSASVAESPTWQPIETWSPDYQDPLVSDGVSVGIGEWCDWEGGHWIVYGASPDLIDKPTHWRPRPSASSVSAAAKGAHMKREHVLRFAHRVGDVAMGNERVVDPDHDVNTCQTCALIADMMIDFFTPDHDPFGPPEPQEGLDLAPIQAREAAATKGPWTNGMRGSGSMGDAHMCQIVAREQEANEGRSIAVGKTVAQTWNPKHIVSYVGFSRQQKLDNAEFIAHARQDIPALLAEVARLRSLSRTTPEGTPDEKDKAS